jgi:PAS domain S-box-containing protein
MLKDLIKSLDSKINKILVEGLSDFIFCDVPALNIICNVDGYFIWVNDFWSLMTGYSKDEIMSVPFESFLHPDDLDNTRAEFQKSLDNKEHVNIDFKNRYRTKDGSYINIRWFSKFDESKQYVLGFAVTDVIKKRMGGVRDKIEFKHMSLSIDLKRSLNKFFFNEVPALACICNKKGVLVWINHFWEDATGYKESELLKNPFKNFIHEDDFEDTYQEFKNVVKVDEHLTLGFENRIKTKDGDYIKVKWFTKYSEVRKHLFSYALTEQFQIN